MIVLLYLRDDYLILYFYYLGIQITYLFHILYNIESNFEGRSG